MYKLLLFILSVFTLLLNSCIGRGEENPCPSGVYLQLSYAERPGYPLIEIEDINRLDVFVYNEEGIFLRRVNMSDMVQEDAHTLYFDLPTGAYHFILWTGAKDEFYTFSQVTPNENRITEGLLTLKRTADNLVPEPPSALRYSRRNGITIDAEQQIRLTLPMQRYTSNIRILMRGLPDDGENHSFTITDNNGTARIADLAFMPDETITYLPRPTSLTRQEPSSTLMGIFTVMRLAQGRSPLLTLYQNTEVRAQWNLIEELIGKYPEAGFGYGNDYEIIFTFADNGYIAFSITINGWEILDEIIEE